MITGLLIGGLVLGSGLLGVFDVKLIPNFNLFGFSFNWFTTICIVLLIFAFIKYGSKNKTLTYVFLAVVTLSLCMVSGFGLVRVQADKARTSETYGKIEYVDVYKDFTVYDIELHKLDSIVFNLKAVNEYAYTKAFDVAFTFNGTVDKYNLLLNDTPATTTISSGGNLYSLHELRFYDLDEQLIVTIPLEVRFKFYVNKIEIELKANVNADHLGFLKQYIAANGVHLRLIDEQYFLQRSY